MKKIFLVAGRTRSGSCGRVQRRRERGGVLTAPRPSPNSEPLSQLTADVSFTPQSAKLVREAAFDKEGGEGYLLTLTDAEGAEIRVALRADEGASPFGRYDFSRANDCVPGSNDGADAATGSWYYASQKAVAPIVGGVLDLSRVPGNKPSDTSYRVQVAFEDDHSPAFGITAVYSGAMTLEGVDATPDATTTYCYAGASGFYADDGYNSWGIDFDNADFTHLLSIFEFNVAPDATEQDGIPAGIYTITEDYAPNTVTWATYDEEMTYLSTGTVTVERDGEEYKGHGRRRRRIRRSVQGRFRRTDLLRKHLRAGLDLTPRGLRGLLRRERRTDQLVHHARRPGLSHHARRRRQLLLRLDPPFRPAQRRSQRLRRRSARRHVRRTERTVGRGHLGRRQRRMPRSSPNISAARPRSAS